jgi:hypothetical protein
MPKLASNDGHDGNGATGEEEAKAEGNEETYFHFR